MTLVLAEFVFLLESYQTVLKFNLDKVLTKYKGLNATELATSESQERMSVAIDKKIMMHLLMNVKKKILSMVHVATVTDRRSLEMYYNDEKSSRYECRFLRNKWVRQHTKATLVDNKAENPFTDKEFSREAVLKELEN